MCAQITSNPKMNADTRNQGIVGMSDGIPMFRSKSSRGVTPIIFRTANLPDELSMKFRYTHLAGLVPSHFWVVDETGKKFQRVERKTSHLCAIHHAITDDLLGWQTGTETEDHSRPPEDPERFFLLRVILLYWCGDYPGQGEASGFSHNPMNKKACHWCDIVGKYSKGIGRQKFGDYYRYKHTLETKYSSKLHIKC